MDCKKVTVSTLAENMKKAWEREQKRESTRKWAERCWKHLLPYFGKMKVADALLSASIEGYQDERRSQGAANGTINRELSALSIAFTIAYEAKPRLVPEKLHFHRLPEPKGRQGFVEQKQYDVLAANCKETFMRTMLALAYSFGFRKAELLNMKVRNVDLFGGTVGIDTSKNGEARKVSLTDETRKLLAACISGKEPQEPLFTRTELSGKRVAVADFRGTWEAVTKTAGCPGLLFHDLRRSAARNPIRAGVSETIAMEITGHKTRAVFSRYNITSEHDLRDTAKKLESAALSYRQANLPTSEQVDEKPEEVQHENIQ